jgi:hypothetical protein
VDVQAAIVVDEAQLSELIQKETHPGPRGADHLGQRFLTDPRNHQLLLPFFTKMGQQQEHPRQPLFARIKELINQVRFDPNIAGQQIRHKQRRKRRLGVEHLEHRGLLNPRQGAVGERRGCRHAQRLSGQAALPKEGPGFEDGDHRFLATHGDDRELYLPVLDLEHRVGPIALRKDPALRLAGHDRSAGTDFGEERVRIECVLVCHNYPFMTAVHASVCLPVRASIKGAPVLKLRSRR